MRRIESANVSSVESSNNTSAHRGELRIPDIGFNTDVYETIELSHSMAANPADVLATNFGKHASLFDKLPHGDFFIADKDGH
jgi:hypothetical protein